MANEVVNENEISLNGYRYRARSPIVGGFIDPFPGQVSIGGDDNRLELSTWQLKAPLYIGNESRLMDGYCWWTNCITDQAGHILPPRLATALTSPTAQDNITPTITNGNCESASSGWSGGDRSGAAAHGGSYSWAVNSTYQDAVTFGSTWKGRLVTISAWLYVMNTGDTLALRVNDGVTTLTSTTTNSISWVQKTLTILIGQTATRLRISFVQTGETEDKLFDDVTVSAASTTIGSPGLEVNFNGELYAAYGTVLAKLNAGRTAFTFVADMGSTITALVSSLNNRLYIFLGDSADNYWYMSTAEVFTESNSANAYWGFQYDNKLFKCNTSGTVAYSTDPGGVAPTWTSGGSITDIASQIQGFVVGRDASGTIVPYCATKSITKVYDSATPAWDDTEVNLGNHPKGGKGHAYFNGKTYFSYGLGCKEYFPENGTLLDMGLTVLDGLPVEYNGEIVKLYGDSGVKLMFAAVDASQVTGTNKSQLLAFDGIGWFSWWSDTSNDRAMNNIIVSSASSGYAVYFDCGGTLYYIDIPRGIQNPDKITQYYAAAGIFLSPWFTAGDQSAKKLAKYLDNFAKGVTTTETIALKYRIDHAYTDLDTGWTTMETLNTTGESGYNSELFASGAGVAFQSIQFRLDFVTAGSTAKADMQNLSLLFRRRTGGLKIQRWIIDVLLDNYSAGEKGNETPKAKQANLKTAIQSNTDVIFCYHRNAAADEAYYVSVNCEKFEEENTPGYEGYYRLVLTEV